MSSSNPWDQYTSLQKLKAMVYRAEFDEDYATELRSNPQAALEQAGFSGSIASSALSSAGPGPLGSECCDTTFGALGLCPGTCYVTLTYIPGVCGGKLVER